MKKFIQYVDDYIDSLIIYNNDVNSQLSYVVFNYNRLSKPLDLLKMGDREFSNLVNYLVFNDSLYIKSRVKNIKDFSIKDKDIIYLENLFNEIKERLSYLIETLSIKDRNNNKLMERLHLIYSAFINDSMADQIVDFNLVNWILKDMNADDNYKKMVINEISENNLKILKNSRINKMNYYLNIEEFNLYCQYLNFIDKKMALLKKLFSDNDGICDYDKYNLCINKIMDIKAILNDLNAAMDLFDNTRNVSERELLLDEKNNYFSLLESLYNQYFDLEDLFLEDLHEDDYGETNKKNTVSPNIIYLTKGHAGSGNVVFSDYLKNIPYEYYNRLLMMIIDMENYTQYENFATNKVLTGVLKDLWEKKKFKVRIYYKKLANNDILILFCDMKKDNETVKKERYIDMLKNWSDEIEYIENIMSVDSEERDNLIAINKKLHDSVKNELSIKGRSR